MRQCLSCGVNVPEHDDICPECGMQIKTAMPPEPSALSPSPAPPVPSMPSPPTAGMARLTVKRNGAVTSETFPLGAGPVIVGRFDPDSGPVDVDLAELPESRYVSRRHVEIWRDPEGQWFIKDLGASNGVFVRVHGEGPFQRIVGEATINDGDEVALGNARFEFRIG